VSPPFLNLGRLNNANTPARNDSVVYQKVDFTRDAKPSQATAGTINSFNSAGGDSALLAAGFAIVASVHRHTEVERRSAAFKF
jgi:hypothetical protein